MSDNAKPLPKEVHAKAVDAMAIALQVNESGKAHAFVELSGHVNALHVRIEPVDTNYQDAGREPVIGMTVYLDGLGWRDVVAELDAAIDYLKKHLEA